MAVYNVPYGENNRKDDYLGEVERFRTRDELQTSTRYNEELPLEAIKQYVRGMPWEVDYFNQIGDVNDLDLVVDNKLAVGNQKYNRIQKLRIYVETALNQTNIRDIKASGTINSGFRPRKGDVFVATLIGGRIGMFKLTEVRMEHYNNHPVYSIEFELINFLEDNPDTYNNLIAKAVGNFVYNKEYNFDQSDMILTRQEFALVEDMKDAIADITDYYFDTFIDRDTKLLMLPSKGNNYVDQELGKFCRKVFSVMDYPQLTELQTVDYEMDKSIKYTIWDLLLTRNIKILRRTEPFIGFTRSPFPMSNLNSIHAHFLDISYIVDKTEYPVDLSDIEDTTMLADLSLDSYPTLDAIRASDSKNTTVAAKAWDQFIPELDFSVKTKTDSGETIIKPVKEVLYGKEEEKEEKPKEPKFEVDNLNTLIGTKVDKEDHTTELPTKPIDRTIPDIRATKQYNRRRP